jgi:transposase
LHSIPFTLPGFEVTEVISTQEQLIICASSQSVQAECPACHKVSQRVHSYYQRSPRDLPLSSQAVQLQLRVRRFRCLNPQCSQKTFAERLPDLVFPTARRSIRLTVLIGVYAMESGGDKQLTTSKENQRSPAARCKTLF